MNSDQGEWIDGIAIVSMAGRFPGANSVSALWNLLREGREGIRTFSKDELIENGTPSNITELQNFVAARGFVEAAEDFECELFGYSHRECQVIDPQQRLLLECCWEALADAALDPNRFDGSVGVFAGVGMNTWLNHLYASPEIVDNVDGYQLMISNDKDFAATRISYLLDLTGPSVGIQTACSTSLVAVATACQSLASGECDAALAGSASLMFPRKSGYLFEEGMILSPDGHCRPFDAGAQGTVPGEGVAVVLLKRLDDAIRDRDHIEAVIRGWAVNNDGKAKIGYTAPSIRGQARVIRAAQRFAGVAPESIGYVETHGTATALGDPIEFAALCEAFGTRATWPRRCAIGSIKSNLGHLDTAAGITGLIKAALTLKHRQIPASLHFESPNPEIDLDSSPFYVPSQLTPWTDCATRRRAGVSSFGIGGTNCHLVLEESPADSHIRQPPSQGSQLLVFSAASNRSAVDFQQLLTDAIDDGESVHRLDDIAMTLRERCPLSVRRAIVCGSLSDATKALRDPVGSRVMTGEAGEREFQTLFLFPGQGSQHAGMGQGLHESFPTFRDQFDACADHLKSACGWEYDLRELVFEKSQLLDETQFLQPALFAVSLGVARQLIEWNVHPSALLGHSVGEYVAACLAGVMSREAALGAVAIRGKLMSKTEPGAMLAVACDNRTKLEELIGDQAEIAAVNANDELVISGAAADIDSLMMTLKLRGFRAVKLKVSHGFHSRLMEPIMSEFEDYLSSISLQSPQIPIVSTVTGDWLGTEQATSKQYWLDGIRFAVQFDQAIRAATQKSSSIAVEVGPSRILQSLAKRTLDNTRHHVLSTMRSRDSSRADTDVLLESIGQLWVRGLPVDCSAGESAGRRVSLPGYAFQRRTFSMNASSEIKQKRQDERIKKQPLEHWFYRPSWQRTECPPVATAAMPEAQSWLIFCDRQGVGKSIGERLEAQQHSVTYVYGGEQLEQVSHNEYAIQPNLSGNFSKLLERTSTAETPVQRVLHCWLLDESREMSFEHYQTLGFYSLLYLCQSLERQPHTQSVRIDVLTTETQDVLGCEPLTPAKATIRGPILVAPQEYPQLSMTHVDLESSALLKDRQWQTEMVFQELLNSAVGYQIAIRGRSRWQQVFAPQQITKLPSRQNDSTGAWIIVGGFGQIGLTVASWIVHHKQAPIVLVSRRELPDPDDWDSWLSEHDNNELLSERIQAVRQLNAAGGEVLVAQADVADKVAMRDVFLNAIQRFGRIAGVVHTAGVVEDQIIHRTSRSDCERVFRAKVAGLETLCELADEFLVPHCIVNSSLSAILGGLGFCAYAASNLYMDAFVTAQNRKRATLWTTINWDGWIFPEATEYYSDTDPILDLTLEAKQGFECLDRLDRSVRGRQVIVSTGDLERRLDAWVHGNSSRKGVDKAVESQALERHPRPNLPVPYEPPRTEIEQAIANIWQEMLGVDRVGIHDDYIALGGHSLLAGRIIGRLRQQLDASIAIRAIFEFPTVGQLSLHVAASRLTYDSQPTDAAEQTEIEL